jgi:cell division protease FtsH
LLIWTVVFLLFVILWQSIEGDRGEQQEIFYSDFVKAVSAGSVEQVTIRGYEITGKYKTRSQPEKERKEFRTYAPPDTGEALGRILIEADVTIKAERAAENPVLAIFLTWGPVLLIVGLWIYFMKGMSGFGLKAFVKSDLLAAKKISTRFSDIAGLSEAKAQLSEIVEFLKKPSKFTRLGGKIPRGVLLMGPPGTGKTLLARAVAGEANVPFFPLSGSSFVEIFMGLGSRRVRELFAKAKIKAPCIIFIDEIDGLGRFRGSGPDPFGAQSEREQTLNQLLIEMDGFTASSGIILIAATNRPDVLDFALMRTGRFDRRISLSLPDKEGRKQILDVHIRNISVNAEVSLERLSELTVGLSGADLGSIVNEAALSAAANRKKDVDLEEFDSAISRVRRGIKEKILLEQPEDKWRVSVHECGHLSASLRYPAIVSIDTLSLHSPFSPDWFSYGEARLPPIVTSKSAEGCLVVLLAGRATEEILLGTSSSLASTDLANATALAYQMSARWGMGEGRTLLNDSRVNKSEKGDSSYVKLDGIEMSITKELEEMLKNAYAKAIDHVAQNAEEIIEWSAVLFNNENMNSTQLEKITSTHDFRARARLRRGLSEAAGLSEEPGDAGVVFYATPDDGDAESSAADKILWSLERTRKILEMQAATLGMNAPPSMIMQLEDVRDSIRKRKEEHEDEVRHHGLQGTQSGKTSR